MATILDAAVYWPPGIAASPKHGLFDVADVRTYTDPHIALGVEYLTNLCSPSAGTWIDMCEPTAEKDIGALTAAQSIQFAVYDALSCPLGVSEEEQETMIRASFDMKAEAAVEAALKASLPATASVSGGSAEEIIAKLEAALADGYAGQGLIHLDRFTAQIAGSQGAFQHPISEMNPVRTWVGTPVAMGRGYGGDGTPWAAATGRVIVLRGPLTVVRAPQTATGDAIVLAEQSITLLIECFAEWGEVGL